MTADRIAQGRTIEAHRSRAWLAQVRIALAGALLGAVSGAALAWSVAAPDDRQIATTYSRTQTEQTIRAAIFPGAAIQRDDNGFAPVEDSAHAVTIRIAYRMAGVGIVVAILFGAGLTTLQRRRWIAATEQAAMQQVLKGASIATPKQLVTRLARTNNKQPAGFKPIMIGAVPLPAQAECRHGLLVGASGSGKSSLLFGLVRQVADRGQASIIYDPDGSYISKFYQPKRGDVILNVWDQRSVRWSPLEDIRTLADAHRVAAVLLPKPPSVGENGFWYDQGRLMLAHVLHHLVRTRGNIDDLLLLLNGDPEDKDNARLRTIVAGTPATRIFALEGGKATASILLMVGLAARTIHTLATISPDAPAFSFDRFIASLDGCDGPRPFLFLAAPRRYRDLGMPVITACLDAVASAILQRTPNRGSQVSVFIDELATLPPIQSLTALMPEGRKYGVSMTLAFQSLAQLNASYGEAAATIVTGQTATQVLMQLGDTLTARWASDLIGQAETETLRPTTSIDSQHNGDRGSLASDRRHDPLVMPSEFTLLEPGEAFLRLAGHPVARLRLPPPRPEDDIEVAPDFIEAPEDADRIAIAESIPVPPIGSDEDWLPKVGVY